MKARTILVLLFALMLGSALTSEARLGETEIEKIKNFALSMWESRPTSCKVCQTIEKSLDFDLALFFLDWQPAAKAICKALTKKYKMSEENCFNVIKRYIVGLKASFTRLEGQTKNNFFCGYIFELCPCDKIEKMSIKPIIEDLYRDQPTPKDPVPTGRSTIKLLQFSDPHLDTDYAPGSIEDCTGSVMCCRADSKPRDPSKITSAGYWGSHTFGDCDLPPHTFEAFLRFATKEVNPDVIIWTGDNPHHEIDQVTPKYNQDITNYIATKTMEAFPGKPIHFCIGNHEHMPVDNLDMITEDKSKVWFYSDFTTSYKPLLSDETFKSFKNRGFYSEYIPELNMRFINLLSVQWETLNFYMLVFKFDPSGQFQWLWETLREAEKNNEFVYITMHVTPGGDSTYQLFDELFSDTIERFRNIIRGIFAGHAHEDQYRFTREKLDNSKIVHPIFIPGSLTTFGGMQPAFRVYEIDRDTGVILDFTQYRLDLAKWNAMDSSVDPTWDVIYKFKDDYLLQDMSRQSMQGLYDNLMDERQPYLNNYIQNKRSGESSVKWNQNNYSKDTPGLLSLKCGFNTEAREYAKCLGWRIFTDFKGDWPDLFWSNMFTHFMKFN